MGDASNVTTNLQISRSGRILKKSVKLKDYEESHTSEGIIQEKLRKFTSVAKKRSVLSSHRQKSTCSQKLLQKDSGPTARAICRNTSKTSRLSSFGSFSKITDERENIVPPIKITKISHDENTGEDPTYSVIPSSSKMLDVSHLVSHSLDSSEESSSDSTAVPSEFLVRDNSVSSHFRDPSIVSNNSSESMSDEESSDNSSSVDQQLNSDEEKDIERGNNTETATNEESSDDSSSLHQLSNSDEEHGVNRSTEAEKITNEELKLFQSTGWDLKSISSNDEVKSTTEKRKFPVVNSENTVVVTGRKKRESRITSFILWSEENRNKISAQYEHLNRREVFKKVAEAWKALDQKEKVLWQRKAKQLALKGSTAQYLQTKQNIEKAVETQHDILNPSLGGSSLEMYPEVFPLGTAPIHIAAHLALLGNSLTSIGLKIAELDYEPSKTGVYSALLDSALCAIGPLLCLTREIAGLEHLPDDNLQKTLDHIAYFFPGL